MIVKGRNEKATIEELQLVVDSLTEAPEQFEELYEDFLMGTLGEEMAETMISMFEMAGESVEIDKYIKAKMAYDA